MLETTHERPDDGSPIERPEPAHDVKPRPVAETVSRELAGKWLAWSSDGLRIVGQGDTIVEALRMGGGGEDLMISKVPQPASLRPTGVVQPPNE